MISYSLLHVIVWIGIGVVLGAATTIIVTYLSTDKSSRLDRALGYIARYHSTGGAPTSRAYADLGGDTELKRLVNKGLIELLEIEPGMEHCYFLTKRVTNNP